MRDNPRPAMIRTVADIAAPAMTVTPVTLAFPRLSPDRLAPVCAMLLAVAASGQALRSGDALDRRVRIHNQTGLVMARLDIAASQRAWRSGDVLGAGGPLQPGDSRAVTIDDGAGACVYDLNAAFANGEATSRRVNVCEISDYYFTR